MKTCKEELSSVANEYFILLQLARTKAGGILSGVVKTLYYKNVANEFNILHSTKS